MPYSSSRLALAIVERVSVVVRREERMVRRLVGDELSALAFSAMSC